MTDFNKFKFIADKKEGPWKKIRIWRYSENRNLFFLASPQYDKNEPLIQTIDFIETGLRLKKFEKYINSDNIHQKLNLMWDNFSDQWEYNGNIYFADKDTNLLDAPVHDNIARIGYYHGKIVWVSGFQYMPRVCFTKLNSIDELPDWTKGGYTKIHHIKPIFSHKDNCYI